MSEELEDRLRKALRPVEPSDGFADRVVAQVGGVAARREKYRSPRWLVTALAASVIGALVFVQYQNRQEEEAGVQARQQLLEALRVTREKLDLAYHAVNDRAAEGEPHSPTKGSGS